MRPKLLRRSAPRSRLHAGVATGRLARHSRCRDDRCPRAVRVEQNVAVEPRGANRAQTMSSCWAVHLRVPLARFPEISSTLHETQTVTAEPASSTPSRVSSARGHPRRLMNTCCERQIGHEGAKAIQCHRLETRWHRKWRTFCQGPGREGEKQWTDWGHRRWVGTKRASFQQTKRFFRSKQLSPAGLCLCLNGFCPCDSSPPYGFAKWSSRPETGNIPVPWSRLRTQPISIRPV